MSANHEPGMRFPVMRPEHPIDLHRPPWPECPAFVPWGMIVEKRDICIRNHSQTPERLAERGGLGVREMLAVLENKHWSEIIDMPIGAAVSLLNTHMVKWVATKFHEDHPSV